MRVGVGGILRVRMIAMNEHFDIPGAMMNGLIFRACWLDWLTLAFVLL